MPLGLHHEAEKDGCPTVVRLQPAPYASPCLACGSNLGFSQLFHTVQVIMFLSQEKGRQMSHEGGPALPVPIVHGTRCTVKANLRLRKRLTHYSIQLPQRNSGTRYNALPLIAPNEVRVVCRQIFETGPLGNNT
jgi:hypothetical protein